MASIEVGRPYRTLLATCLALGLLIQIFVFTSTRDYGQDIHRTLTALGATLPLISRAYFATCRYWWAFPAMGALLAIDVLRRREAPEAYVFAIVLWNLLGGFILQAWANMALWAPFLSLMAKISE